MDVFQSVAWYEAEVVAMTVALLEGKEKASGGQICGNMTSAGTGIIICGNMTSIVGSAPGFPHGIIDPIEELAELAFGSRVVSMLTFVLEVLYCLSLVNLGVSGLIFSLTSKDLCYCCIPTLMSSKFVCNYASL
ncbi:hypothetical protein TEA_018313 [Camellia sinensis var. sinensis]|uniref:Uncharacterized protein n=1 Tax=Camellia sinensis var. sinensis TaxID=542762 RepID=A0A4S4EM98_CAMSN|nr:hypothetical protein TEA_018313 [Camellia sinensis var. sinensis]